MNESEINKLIKDMVKKFKNGGFIDCLRGGGSVKDCGCESKIEKAGLGKGDLGTSTKLPYYRPSRPDRGVMRKPVPEGVLNMFNGIRSRFEPSPELKKCGGPLPKKSKLKK